MPAVGIGISPLLSHQSSGSPTYNAITTAWIAQVILNGGSVTPSEAAAVNTYTDSIQTNEFDRLWVHGLQNEIAAKTSIINPTSTMITNVNSTRFAPGEGFTGDGVTTYLDTNFNQLNDSVKYQQSDCSYGNYTTVSGISSNTLVMGCNSVSTLSYYSPDFPLLSGALFTANSLGSNSTGAALNSDGFHVIARALTLKYFKNGVSTYTDTVASSALFNGNFYILGRNNNGIPSNLTTNAVAMSFIGSSAANTGLYATTQTLATTLGFNV